MMSTSAPQQDGNSTMNNQVKNMIESLAVSRSLGEIFFGGDQLSEKLSALRPSENLESIPVTTQVLEHPNEIYRITIERPEPVTPLTSVKSRFQIPPIHRIFIRGPGVKTDLQNLGYILAKEIEFCMCCHEPFAGFAELKHHCPACGDVVCENCLKNKCIIEELDPKEAFNVCSSCHASSLTAFDNILRLFGIEEMQKKSVHTRVDRSRDGYTVMELDALPHDAIPPPKSTESIKGSHPLSFSTFESQLEPIVTEHMSRELSKILEEYVQEASLETRYEAKVRSFPDLEDSAEAAQHNFI